MSETGFVDVYADHGVELIENGRQMKGECPFCGHDSFYVNLHNEDRKGRTIEKGMWDCFTCGGGRTEGIGGNQYTFMNELWSRSKAATTKDDYRELSSHRGISASILQKCNLVRSTLTGMWMIPARNANGKLSNLYVYDGRSIKSSTNCFHQIWGVEEFQPGLPVWLVEGHWDRMALMQVLARLGVKANVLACPGANVFKRQWLRFLKGQDVTIVFDNDDAGKAGVERVLEMILAEESKPKSLKVMSWEGVNPDVWNDIRDMLKFHNDPRDTYEEICSRLKTQEMEGSEYRSFVATPRSSFKQLLADFESHLLISEAFENCLASSLAVQVGTRMKGEPLWLYIVGPASSGKSTICEALSCSRDYVFPMSKIRPNALDSGWQESGGGDVSLIPLFNNKTLVIKDFTTVLSLPSSVQENVFGILRDCYDGVYRSKHGGYGGQGREYWSRFGIVAGVTYEIRVINRTALGERFLQAEIVDNKRKAGIETERNLKAIDQLEREMYSGTGDEVMDELRSCTLGFMEHLHYKMSDGIPSVEITDGDKQYIAVLAEFCSMMRSQVKRDMRDKLLVRPTREQSQRLARQLFKMAVCQSIVYNQESMSNHTRKMLRRIALNTSSGFVLDLVLMLLERGESTADSLSNMCSLSPQNVRAALDDMRDLGIVRSYRKGHRSLRYNMSTEVTRLWESISKVR